jgi:hypothetical protein
MTGDAMVDGAGVVGTAAVDRREALRRGAVVGGGLLWATPVVQALAGPAFATTEGSAPPFQGDKALSYVAILYVDDAAPAVELRAKAHTENTARWVDAGEIPFCTTALKTWAGARKTTPSFATAIQKTGSDVTQMILWLPKGFTFLNGVWKGGTDCSRWKSIRKLADGRTEVIFESAKHKA